MDKQAGLASFHCSDFKSTIANGIEARALVFEAILHAIIHLGTIRNVRNDSIRRKKSLQSHVFFTTVRESHHSTHGAAYVLPLQIRSTKRALKMNPLGDAIRWNNEAAKLLLSGDLLAADQLIRQAIYLMHCVRSTLCHDDEWTRGSHSPETTFPKDNAVTSLESDGIMYVFQRPILLPTNVAITASQEYLTDMVHAVSTCLIFNLALVSHIHGMKSGSSPSLLCAMELYQMVLAIPFFDSRLANLPVTNCLLHALALNNLVHIHHEFCEYDSSSECLCCMLDLFLTTGCFDDESFLSEHEAEELKLNIAYRYHHGYAPAA